MRRLAWILAVLLLAGGSFAGGWFLRPPEQVVTTVTEYRTVEKETRRVPWTEPRLFGPPEFKEKFTEAMNWLREVEPETYWHVAGNIDQIVYTEGEWGQVIPETRTILAAGDKLNSDIEALAGALIHESIHVDQYLRALETGVVQTRDEAETEAMLAEIEFYKRHGLDWAVEAAQQDLDDKYWTHLN